MGPAAGSQHIVNDSTWGMRGLPQHLGTHAHNPAQLPDTPYFSCVILDLMSELPLSVIKKLKSSFRNYIPLSFCMHQACLNATCSTDMFNTKIGMNERGEIRLKQKTMSSAKDQFMTCIDLTEICENFVCGMVKYLVLDGDSKPGTPRALACASMFHAIFSTITARLDFTLDWTSYKGYMIETYSSWIGQRDHTYGIIFNEGLFFKYKMQHLLPAVMDHLHTSGFNNTISNPASSSHGQSCSYLSWPGTNTGWHPSSSQAASSQIFPPNQHFPNPTSSFHIIRCYLCGEQHVHRNHQGPAK